MSQMSFLRFTLSKNRDTEKQAGELRQDGLYGREHWPRSPDRHRFQKGPEDSQLLRSLYQVFYTMLLTQSENSSPISLSYSLFFQSLPETDDNWPALPADISSKICSYVHLQTLAIYHMEASCVGLCLGPNLAFCFRWIWAVDWLFIKSLFQWWVCKCFLQNLWVSVWFVFPWALLSVLHCRRHKRENCDSFAVSVCKIYAFSDN